jgi:hypothetical protein
MSIVIGKPDFVGASSVHLARIPEHVLELARTTPCKIVRGEDSTFYLVNPAGERLGEFKPLLEGEHVSSELLKLTTPTACFPVLDDVTELWFKTLGRQLPVRSPPPKRVVPTVAVSPSKLQTWSKPRTLRSLAELQSRFYDSRQQQLGLLREIEAAVVQQKSGITPGLLQMAYTDVMAFTQEQEACVEAARTLANALGTK